LILSVFESESESEQKYENKYNIDDIRLYPIRFHPYFYSILYMKARVELQSETRKQRKPNN